MQQDLMAQAIVDGPMKADSTSPRRCSHIPAIQSPDPSLPGIIVTVNQASLASQVLSLAVIATLAGFMVTTFIKHKHYLYEQQPHSHGKASAEGVTRPIPQRLTLLQLLTVTDTDDLDAMVVLLLVGIHIVWRMASGLATCLAMTCQACAFAAAAIRTRLFSFPLQWTNPVLNLCLATAKKGLPAPTSRILMTAERDGLATKLQAADFFRTATDDYLHDLLRRARIGHLRLKGKPGITASESGPWSGRNFKTNFPKANAARAKQLHAAELSDVISNLELSKQDLAHSEQARVAEADNSASLTATLQSLKSFCDSQTHKLSESCADLHISDHLRNSSEKRLEGVTAQRDRLADQVDSLRNGNYAQDREVRAVEFKCVTLRQQLAEALSGKTELALYAEQLTAEKLTVCGPLLQVTAQKTQLASERTVALTEKANGRKQLQQLQRGNDDVSAQLAATLSGKAAAEQHAQQLQADHADLSAQLTAALSGKAAAEQHAQQLQADLTVVSAGKQGSERQLALLEGQNEELQHQLTAASKEAAQHATHIGRSLVAKERLQAHLTAKSKQNQQLAEKVAKLEADVSRLNGQSLQELAGLQSRLDSSLEHLRLSRAELEAMSAQTHARFEREAEQHAAFVQQLQQQRDREARAHRKEVTRLRDLLEVAHPAKSHTSEVSMDCNVPHIKTSYAVCGEQLASSEFDMSYLWLVLSPSNR
ncbi:TPA: hypothetical protein ACH3X1_000419 [Trebouxia sp. C0004]